MDYNFYSPDYDCYTPDYNYYSPDYDNYTPVSSSRKRWTKKSHTPDYNYYSPDYDYYTPVSSSRKRWTKKSHTPDYNYHTPPDYDYYIPPYYHYYLPASPSRNCRTESSLKNNDDISPTVETHLKKVYLALFCALIISAAVVYVYIRWDTGEALTTPKYEEQKWASLLIPAAIYEGASSIGPLIKSAVDLDPSIVISAFVGCALAFICFSAAAILAKRREYLRLGVVLSFAPIILFLLQFASFVFKGSLALFQLELYFGLLVFVVCILVDTQKIIEDAHSGALNYLKHALPLFTVFVSIFVRILKIRLKKASKN